MTYFCRKSYTVLDREKAGLIALAPMAVSIPVVDRLETVNPRPCPLLGHRETTIELADGDRMIMAPTIGTRFENLGDQVVRIMSIIVRPNPLLIPTMIVAILPDRHVPSILWNGHRHLTAFHHELSAIKSVQGTMGGGTRDRRHPTSQDLCLITSIIQTTARFRDVLIRITPHHKILMAAHLM